MVSKFSGIEYVGYGRTDYFIAVILYLLIIINFISQTMASEER